MKKLKFPIITNKTRPVFPDMEVCPICGTNRNDVSAVFVMMGGALQRIDKDTLGMSDNLHGFLDLRYHHLAKSTGAGRAYINIIDHSDKG